MNNIPVDSKEALKQIKAGDFSLQDVDKKLKGDKEVVLAAVKQDGYALEYVDEKLKGDKEVILAAIKQNASFLRYADKKLKADKEVVLAAVKKNGSALQYADKKLKANKEVVLAAVKHDGSALKYADKSLKKDKEVVLAAVKRDGRALKYADAILLKNKIFIMKAAKLNSEALKYANELSLEEEASQVTDSTGKKITKISIYLYDIGERETMPGTFFFEDGTSKEGYSYNNNMLSGTIDFSNEEYSIPIKDFIQSFKNNEWTQFISDSIDNFDGSGNSIDYEFDDFENFEEGNSDGCEWDAEQDPQEIILYYGEVEFKLTYQDVDCYINNGKKYKKTEILSVIKKSI